MKKTATLLLSLAVLGVGAGAGLLLQPSEKVLADEPVANTQLMIEQTDFDGKKVTVPVYYDGEKYILADYTRNIFVYDASTATNIFDEETGIFYNPVHQTFPLYTSSNGVFIDKMAITEYNNVIKTFDYYSKNFGWNGIYGTNDEVSGNWEENDERLFLIFVHSNCDIDTDGGEYLSSVISGQAYDYMLLGDGESYLKNQGRALDVIGHELQHGVTDALGYNSDLGDPKAFDEAASDIFGMLIEGKDINSDAFWEICEDAMQPGYRCMRSTKNPSLTHGEGYASTVFNKHTCDHSNHSTACDYGYSHYNSTVFSHLQYTVWKSLPEYFTPERIGHLWWELIQLMAKESKNTLKNNCWETFGLNMLKAAETLEFSQEAQTAIRNSLITNGFIEGEITPPVEEDPPVENPPVENPPVENPPVENPPVENPPVENPPVENPPVENPPVENPPTTEKKSSGCGGVIGVGAAAIAAVIILGGAALVLKRKNETK